MPFRNMRIIIIPTQNTLGHHSDIIRMMVLDEPFSTVTLDGLVNICPVTAKDGLDTTIALPGQWRGKIQPTNIETVFYDQNIPVHVPGHNGGRSRENRFCVISSGRYVTDIDKVWLSDILADSHAQIIAVTVEPGLSAFREKVRLTSSGNIAGFRRFYCDNSLPGSIPPDWPHHIFIQADILERLLLEGSLPAVFSEFLSRCADKSLELRSVRIAGTVFDMETETDCLAFISKRLDEIWPENQRGFLGTRQTSETVIQDGTRIFGKVLLGQNVQIHTGATIIGPAIICDNVRIKQDAVVKSSVIGGGITLPAKYIAQNTIITDKSQLDGGRLEHKSRAARKRYFHSLKRRGLASCNYAFRMWPRFSYVGCAKRVADVIAAVVFIFLFAPVIPVVALVIKLTSRGPVFYRDKRQGLNGREFKCTKFRTMVTGADSIQKKLRSVSEVDGPQFKMADDPRVNMVGKFLRDTCIDEIPQFFNVLVGQMSLVGPRPSPASENALCPSWRDARLSVRPGITGLWQICRTRSEGQDFQEWILYDTKYVRNLSFKLDLWICWQTTKKLVWDFMRQF